MDVSEDQTSYKPTSPAMPSKAIDASGHVIGVVLQQPVSWIWEPLKFFSRRLIRRKRNMVRLIGHS